MVTTTTMLTMTILRIMITLIKRKKSRRQKRELRKGYEDIKVKLMVIITTATQMKLRMLTSLRIYIKM